jgi:hypothetical protein
MATEQPGLKISLDAAADLSAKQFYGLKVDANGRAAVAGAGELCIGILQNDPDALGRAASITTLGPSKGVAGAAVAAGAEVATDANGKLITAVAADRVVGTCLEAALADGDIVTFYVNPGATA